MVVPDSGAVAFDARDVTRLPMYKRARLGMGYLPQETEHLPHAHRVAESDGHPRNPLVHPQGTQQKGRGSARTVRPEQGPQPAGDEMLRRRENARSKSPAPSLPIPNSSCSTSRSAPSTRWPWKICSARCSPEARVRQERADHDPQRRADPAGGVIGRSLSMKGVCSLQERPSRCINDPGVRSRRTSEASSG